MSTYITRRVCNKKLIVIFFFLAVGGVFSAALVGKRVTFKQKAQTVVWSPKKGVGGGATLAKLNELRASWFFNWGYLPGYLSGSGYDNWEPPVWEKFVPMLTVYQSRDTGSIAGQVEQICTKTSYCNKRNYYLVGNEPDEHGQGLVPGTADPVADAVQVQGEITQKVLAKDPTAKLIILGLKGKDENFIRNFIIKWKERWQGTNIANLKEVVAGWHFHTYSSDFTECPADDSLPRGFMQIVSDQLGQTFGQPVPAHELWITEIGTLDNVPPQYGPGRERREEFLRRMECLVNVYESSPVVTRYAWYYFGCNPEINSFSRCADFAMLPYNLFLPPYSGMCVGDPFCPTDLSSLYARLPAVVSPTGVSQPTAPLPTGISATATPLPTSTPVPVATQTPLPTAIPTGLPPISPTLTPTKIPPTSTPTLIPLANLTFYFKLQGINSSGAGKSVRVILKRSGVEIKRFENVSVASVLEGIFQGRITDIPPGIYDIYLKGEAHLQKKFAGIIVASQGNTADWSSTALKAGDFDDTNSFTLTDISLLLSKYTALSNSVNNTNKLYDINADSILNIQDISLVLSNYTALELKGEE